ncbi:MAG: hypothetical protein Tsb0034_05330 [Ekhidna sp.]
MRSFILILVISSSLKLFSQQIENKLIETYNDYKYNNPMEFAYLNTDKDVYFSGDYLRFNVALLDQYFTTSSLSEIVYIALVSQSGDFNKSYPFRLTKGAKSAGLLLPEGIPSGNYQLVAYTHFMRNYQLDELSMRRNIYIQNTSEPVEGVMHRPKKEKLTLTDQREELEIKINETSTKVLFEINADNKTAKDCYLVSEGFGVIQFVGKVRLNKKKTNVSISKDQLKGNFQKLILIDDEMSVLGARSFFLKSSSKEDGAGEGDLCLGQGMSTLISHGVDSIGMFRRIYQLYYNIPSIESLSSLTYDELTSDQTLRSFSYHTIAEWNRILDTSDRKESFPFMPEKNLHIRAQLKGDLSELENGYLGIHFFRNGLDLVKRISASGKINTAIEWPLIDDNYFLTILNEDRRDVSEKFTIEYAGEPEIAYKELSPEAVAVSVDSMLIQNRDFHYILSTFNEVRSTDGNFWEGADFSQVAREEDYRGLSDFEEFIREAVIEVSISRRDGEKSLSVYNPTRGTFEFPQMLILNDKVLNSAEPLFDISLDELESVNVISNKEKLERFGATFSGGIVIVVTKNNIDVTNDNLNPYFGSITGFPTTTRENEVSSKFNPTKYFEIYSDASKRKGGSDVTDTSKAFHIEERIYQDGTYKTKRD